MTRRQWISAVLTLVTSMTILGSVAAAGTIPNVGGGSAVTLSVFRNDAGTFRDVTDSYLPTWTPSATDAQRTVYIVVNASETPPTLVAPTSTAPSAAIPNPYLAERTTSKFRGNCTNFGDDTGPDFAFDTLPRVTINGRTGYSLTAKDCGGMAVIAVGANDKFIVPKDADAAGQPTGIPDALDVFGVVLRPQDDPDSDGLTTFDETVRGFIIGGQHVRLNPTVKDLFVNLVKGQCGPSLLTTAGGFPVAGAGGIDANLNTLIRVVGTPPPGISTSQVHFLGNSLSPSTTALRSDEWVDHFVSFTLGSNGTTETWNYCSVPLSSSATSCTANTVVVTAGNGALAPTTDRSVSKNQIYGDASTPMKGLRLTECATTSGTSPHGTGRYGAGAAQGKDEAVVYTDRIRRFVNGIGTRSSNIFYSTFSNGTWATPSQVNSNTVSTTQARNFISSKIMQYITAMEIGHTLSLLDQSLLQTVPTFPHYSAGYGDNMDEAVQATTSGGVKFYIPSTFQGASQGGLELIPPPAIQ